HPEPGDSDRIRPPEAGRPPSSDRSCAADARTHSHGRADPEWQRLREGPAAPALPAASALGSRVGRVFRPGVKCRRNGMARTSEVPVLIVGGGAVGCVLSLELARRGIEFRCIDRLPAPARESRAIALHARTIELMNLVDRELSTHLLDRGLWCKG